MFWVSVVFLTLLGSSKWMCTSWEYSTTSGPRHLTQRTLDKSVEKLMHDTENRQNGSSTHILHNFKGGDSLSIDTLSDNHTQILEDSHKYYAPRVLGHSELQSRNLWMDLVQENSKKIRVHGILSNAHRQASRVTLSFDFPFYGHPLRHITIATGGFIFMGDIIHRMLTATQYVAPLMANFNPSYSEESKIIYRDNGTSFVVQWDKVRLHEKEEAGGFTFQAALYKDGRILFVYKEIPLPVQDISPAQHPVKAGLSEAFVVLHPLSGASETQKKAIYEYHRVQLDLTKIQSQTAVEFNPLPTCLQQSTCEQCVTPIPGFNCTWCHVLQRCSSGFDRNRQDWITFGCDQESQKLSCEEYTTSYTVADMSQPSSTEMTSSVSKVSVNFPTEEVPKQKKFHVHFATAVGIILAVLLITIIILGVVYNTHQKRKQGKHCRMKYRTHQWAVMKFNNNGSPGVYTVVNPIPGPKKEDFMETAQ